MSVQVASVRVCLTCTRPAAQPSLIQGQQTYLQLNIFDYSTGLANMSETKQFFSVIKKHDKMIALNQQACLLQLHPTTWHVGYN